MTTINVEDAHDHPPSWVLYRPGGLWYCDDGKDGKCLSEASIRSTRFVLHSVKRFGSQEAALQWASARNLFVKVELAPPWMFA